MKPSLSTPRPAAAPLAPVADRDAQVVERVLRGEIEAFAELMRRHNQRVFRLARAIVGNDEEAEDVAQEAYLRAFSTLDRFEGRATFSTWLLKIAAHEASARRRRARRIRSLEELPGGPEAAPDAGESPDQAAAAGELGGLLRTAVDDLPPSLRSVLVLRQVEGLSTAETAACLGLSTANVKVRLHRARAELRAGLEREIGRSLPELYRFGGSRCDRMVAAVMSRIAGRPL